jgi:sugar lactone lactonase YvrE
MPDGSMLVSEGLTPRVRKITPDGKMVTLAGNGTRQAPAALGVKATASTLWSPGQVACGPDGRVYFTEQPRKGQIASRILYVDEQGLLQALPTPPGPEWQSTEFSGLGFAPDGTIWVLNCATAGDPGWLARKKPGADWEIVLRGIDTAVGSKLAIAPDGTVYVSASGANQILRVDPATLKSRVVAGTGQAGFTGDGGPATAAQLNAPDGIWPDASGAIYFVDSGNGLVRKIDPAGVITTVAGATGVTQAGDALSVSINQPGGLALDAQGRLLIAEIASGTIKRLDGQQLSVIAGSTKGFAGDGGPATQARFDAPSGLVYDAAGNLIVVDSANVRIRKIAPDGTVSTIAGKGDSGGMGGKTSVPASEALMRRPTSAAIGPDGLLYWTDNENNLIQRLSKDGTTVELVAGAPDYQTSQGDVGDGGPATQAKLSHPFGLAFDKAGNLYFADFGNLRVRKIDTQGVITSVAGLPQAQLLPKLLGGAAPNEEGLDAKQAMLVGPAALCFDAAGNLYVSELGTVNLTSLGSGVGALPIPVELLPKVYARIRKIAPDGKITTVAGPGTKLLNDPSSDNSLKLPTGLVFDAQGRLIVCDAGTNQVKMLPKGAF